MLGDVPQANAPILKTGNPQCRLSLLGLNSQVSVIQHEGVCGKSVFALLPGSQSSREVWALPKSGNREIFDVLIAYLIKQASCLRGMICRGLARYQIGLALWGWVLSGLIIGYEINTRNGAVVAEKKIGKTATKPAEASAATTLAMFVGLIVGVLVGMPPYLASAKYKGALETSNPNVIQEAAYIWPVDPSRMIQVAATLNENKLEAQGLQVALDAVERFPDNYQVWATLNSMTSATAEQKAQALVQMKRLDPLNPNLK